MSVSSAMTERQTASPAPTAANLASSSFAPETRVAASTSSIPQRFPRPWKGRRVSATSTADAAEQPGTSEALRSAPDRPPSIRLTASSTAPCTSQTGSATKRSCRSTVSDVRSRRSRRLLPYASRQSGRTCSSPSQLPAGTERKSAFISRVFMASPFTAVSSEP